MRWSIEELFRNIIFVFSGLYRLRYKILYFPRNLFRMFKVIFIWIFTGYGYTTEYNLDIYFTRVLLKRIKKYHKNFNKRYGYPGFDEADTEDNWKLVLEKIIRGFEAYLELDAGLDNPDVSYDFEDLFVEHEDSEHVIDGVTAKRILIKAIDEEAYKKYKEAQTAFEKNLRKEFNDGMKLFTKFYMHFWD